VCRRYNERDCSGGGIAARFVLWLGSRHRSFRQGSSGSRRPNHIYMTLRIYNTLSRQIDEFTSLEPNHVRMYVCGMTVYDVCHLGHARSMVAFDVVQRWLKASGFQVTYVRNVTDIDDKIIRRALENKETIGALTERMVALLHRDADALGVQRPDHEPRATQYVGQMLGLIERLEQRGLAYQAPNHDVNFAVRKFAGYGKLSGKSLDALRAGERVAVDDGKADPLDFVLWKSAKATEPDDAKWPSVFGPGRPGWHIECSAMACDLLGESFDIHGGGADLQFPHHENEIAQSEGAFGKPLARFWMHNGFVTRDSEKMSKSLGNFFTIQEILERFGPETTRFFIARAHYRSALNYSDLHLEDARSSLKRLYTALQLVPPADVAVDWTGPYGARFKAAMDEDFGTPEAVAVLFDLAGEVNRTRSPQLSGTLKVLGACLGFLQQDPEKYLQTRLGSSIPVDGAVPAVQSLSAEQIGVLIVQRAQAKTAKNFVEADRIRQHLLQYGIALKDSPLGTTWEAAQP